MTSADRQAGLFPAMLKYWRGKRGLSQLDLALTAEVSSRHLSFLETGRAKPSQAMVLRLACALDVSLRQANAMLRAAGFPARYPEPGPDRLPAQLVEALALMKAHHEPYPMLVLDRRYDILDMNAGAAALFGALLRPQDPAHDTQPHDAQPHDTQPHEQDQADEPQGPARHNLARLTFSQALRGTLLNAAQVRQALLWRIQREVLDEPDEGPLAELLEELLQSPTIDPAWRDVDLASPSSPLLDVHLRVGQQELRFMTMVTSLQAPQTVTLDELRIETWFPMDAATTLACTQLGAPSDEPPAP